jgi:thiol-disulfide isomerase/thioredoxin
VSDSRTGPRPRVRAPELRGRGWLNAGGREHSLADFRGRFLLLDFWAFCCVNCLHVLDELRPLERRYAGERVVVGVHSPKFVHEADPAALAAAVERYQVEHLVLDDPELVTWQAYTARAWPTLVLVDPEGYVVAQYAGEGHAHAIGAVVDVLTEVHRAKGTLQPGDSPFVAPAPREADLRYPAKAVTLPWRGLLVADAGGHCLVELAEDAETVVRRIGTGERGLADGGPDDATFQEPNGLCLLPDDVAAEVGYDVVVADTVNHALRGVRLGDGTVRTLAGDGTQWMRGAGTESLSSPWDVAWWQDRVWVAMAGIHQLWRFDPRSGTLEVAGGTGTEGLRDGPLAEAWLAQTSGLAPTGNRLWLADSETSSLRYVQDGLVHTVVGSGLFDFGFRDGASDRALLQHPLGVSVLPDGSVAVCDTYNGAVRRWADGELSTIADGLAEPSGAVVSPPTGSLGASEHLVVVESAAHRLTRVPLGDVVAVSGFAQSTQRPVTEVAGGVLELVVDFEPPPGQKVDERLGPSSQLVVSATPAALLRGGDGRGVQLSRTLVIDPAVGDGILHVAARAASCDEHAGEGAACHMHQQDWGVPVRVTEGGATRLVLPLSRRG